jgi:transcription-repair coupling factor (superfamily II helicase)
VIPVSEEIAVRDRRIVIRGGCDDVVERGTRAAVFLRRLQDARDRRG